MSNFPSFFALSFHYYHESVMICALGLE